MSAWHTHFVEIPAVVDLVMRITLVLLSAWGVHGLLAGCNPRWRVQLWRLTSVAVIVVAAATFLPRFAVVVDRQKEQRLNRRETSPRATVSRPIPVGTAMHSDFANLLPENDWAEPPLESFIHGDENVSANRVTTDMISSDGTASTIPGTSKWAFRLIGTIWAAGAFFLAVRWTMAQLRIRRLLSRTVTAPRQSAQLLRRIAERLDIFADFELHVSAETDVPFVAGLWRPVVVLPARMAQRAYARELPAIFAHELSHVKSHDLVWMGVSQWIAIPLWFHPLTWRFTTAHSMACEEVADAVAVDNVGNVARYSATLARVALAAVSHPPAAAAISMARSSQIMSRLARLKRGLSNTPLARRWVILSALAGLLVVLPLATIKLAYADNESATAANSNDQAGRVLHFPKNRSVGMLYFATEKEDELWDKYSKAFDYRRDWAWKYAGQAQGDVTIPAGAYVKLNLKENGAANMSWVERLDPDDIYEMRVYPHPSSPNPFKFGDAQVRHLGYLTGLRELELKYVQVTGRGLRALEPLKSLEKLTVYSPEAGNDSLRSIGKLTGLQSLILGKGKWDDTGLAYLADLKDLEEINLPFSGVPGKGFDAVLQLPNLKYIASHSLFKNAHMARLKKSPGMRALNLQQNVNINDDSLRYIAQLPHLEYLDLYQTNITDAGLQHLRKLKSLKRLNIQVNRQGRKPGITATGLAIVAELPELETLRLGSVGNADEGLELLSSLKNLKSLGIGGRRDTGLISDDGVKQLTKLQNLEDLSLWGLALTDAGAEQLSRLTALKKLHLLSVGFTDDGLAQLSKLKELEYLSLQNTNKHGSITTAGVSRLKGLTKLNELHYSTSNNTPAQEALDFSGFPELRWLTIGRLRDKDLVSLANCEKLKRLELGLEGPITDEGLSHLASLRHLEMLTIPGEGITDEGLLHLANMEQLDMLNIRGHITDAGLHQLAQYKTLGSVTINTTQRVSPAAIKQLHNSLPNLWMFSINQNRAGIERPKRKPMRSGKQAPPFQLTLLDGSEVSLKDYRGKVVLLYFWSTSCKPCVASFPKLKKVYKNLSKYQDFAMIGLSGDDNELIWKNFVEKHELTWPQARIGDNSKMATAYGVAGLPRYIVIGRDGTILASEAAQVGTALQKALEDHEE